MAKRVAKPKAVKEPKPKKEAEPRKKELWQTMLDEFWSASEFKKYSNYERGKAYFMLNRRLCIAHPKEAALVSKVGINTGQIVKWWRNYMISLYNTKPGWLFTKANPAGASKKEYKPSKETMNIYCKWHDCTIKDIEEALKFFPTEMKAELEEIENYGKATE